MASIYKISFTPEAQNDFIELVLSLSEITWNPSVKKWSKKILDKINSLTVFPEGCPKYEHDNECRSTKVGKYRIIYEIFEEEQIVSILRILYARRDLKEVHIKKHIDHVQTGSKK